MTYAVTIEFDTESGVDVDDLLDGLSECAPSVATLGRRVSVTLDVNAPTIAQASANGVDRVRVALAAKAFQVLALEAVTHAEQERRLAAPLMPELVGAGEIAEMLGVSKQRVAQLRDRADFPVPIAVLKAGPVWTRDSLNQFLAGWSRKPGRRPLVAAGQ